MSQHLAALRKANQLSLAVEANMATPGSEETQRYESPDALRMRKDIKEAEERAKEKAKEKKKRGAPVKKLPADVKAETDRQARLREEVVDLLASLPETREGQPLGVTLVRAQVCFETLS